MITSLGDKPSYIPPSNFARAFLGSLPGKVQDRKKPVRTIEELQQMLPEFHDDDAGRLLLAGLVGEAKDLWEAREKVEKWFDLLSKVASLRATGAALPKSGRSGGVENAPPGRPVRMRREENDESDAQSEDAGGTG